MSRFLLLSMALTVVLAQAAMANTISISVANSGFEDHLIIDSLGNPVGCQYSSTYGDGHVNGPLPTTGLGWTFGPSVYPGSDALDGLIRDSGWGDAAYAGAQMAFVTGTGYISQDLSGFQTGTATVSFYALGRTTYGPTGLKATINGTTLTFSGNETITPGSSWLQYTSNSFDVTAGTNYALTISGTIPLSTGGDLSSYVDNVSVLNSYTIPEPSAVILMVTGLIGLLAYAWRERK